MIDLTELEVLNDSIQKLEPGERIIIPGLDPTLYHAADGIGSTALKRFIDAPAKYKAYKDGLVTFTSKALEMGSAIHCKILEPHLFLAEFVEIPGTIKTKRGKVWDAFKAQHEGKIFLTASEVQKVEAITDAVLDIHAEYFTGGEPEQSYFYRDIETNLILKARVDYDVGDLAIDLKTTNNAEPKKWTRSSLDFGYHIQAALYRLVTGKKDFGFVVVETEAPYISCGPLMYGEDLAKLGELKVKRALPDLADYTRIDVWPGYFTGPYVMEASPWHITELNELLEE